MFLTSDQLLLHLLGDYLLQSDWMAMNKTKSHLAALVHALTYSVPFLLLSPSWIGWILILSTHELIDRYRLARYVVWAKNFLGPRGANQPWKECSSTGYPAESAERPAWLTVWLLIIADNIIHLLINGVALKYL